MRASRFRSIFFESFRDKILSEIDINSSSWASMTEFCLLLPMFSEIDCCADLGSRVNSRESFGINPRLSSSSSSYSSSFFFGSSSFLASSPSFLLSFYSSSPFSG